MPRCDTATVRRLAAEAETDPRTIRKLLEGKPVRGLAAHRARRVLVAAGLLRAEIPLETTP